jgi:hypothetical protein
MNILNKTIVLVLNRNWQAINIRTPQEAFCMMATNVATALDIELGDGARAEALRSVTWDEWITLPIRDGDNAMRTVRGAIRVPTVIVAVNFARVRTVPVKYRQWGEHLEHDAVMQMEKACLLPVSVAGALMPDAHVGCYFLNGLSGVS